MIFSVISILPQLFDNFAQYGVVGRAFVNKICQLQLINPRQFVTDDNYRRVDDKAYGGGAGMVMKVAPLEAAILAALDGQAQFGVTKPLKIYLSPQGTRVDQSVINQLAGYSGIILVCGRYEGVDERFIERNIDLELSIADIVVSGGELPAMLLIDAIVRRIPSVLNNIQCVQDESFVNDLLDCPHYTTPPVYDNLPVPEVLLSGNHQEINKWRFKMSLWRTYLRRPDLLQKRQLTASEEKIIADFTEK